MKVRTKVEQGRLTEGSHAQVEFKYALLNPESGETLTPWFKCRDYVNDIFWAYYNNAEIDMYGFRCNGNSFKKFLDMDTFTFAIKLEDKISGKRTPITATHTAGISLLLHKFEQVLGYFPSVLEVCDDTEHIIVTLDKAWSKIPYIQSTLMLLLRLGWTYSPNEDFIEQYTEKAEGRKFISPNDMTWMTRIKYVLKQILEGNVDTRQTYDPKDGPNKVHNYYGIVSYAQNYEWDTITSPSPNPVPSSNTTFTQS